MGKESAAVHQDSGIFWIGIGCTYIVKTNGCQYSETQNTKWIQFIFLSLFFVGLKSRYCFARFHMKHKK